MAGRRTTDGSRSSIKRTVPQRGASTGSKGGASPTVAAPPAEIPVPVPAETGTAPIAIAAAISEPSPVRVDATVAEPVQQSTQKEHDTMATTAETTVRETADTARDAANTAQHQASAMFGDLNERSKAAMEKSARMAEEMNDFAKGNVEAIVESSRIAAKGMESIGQDAAEFTRRSFEQATTTMKSLASAKSPTELFKLQSDYMRSSFDMFVAEASKNTERMMKLASEAAQPLSNRAAIAADKARVAA